MPMNGDKDLLSRSRSSDYISKSSLKNLSKGNYFGLIPKQITIGDKTNILLKISKDDMKKFHLSVGHHKKLEYFNTLALSQQRTTFM